LPAVSGTERQVLERRQKEQGAVGNRHARRGHADLHVGGPEGEVVTQQLHDEGAVLVRLLAQRVQLRDGLVKGLRTVAAGKYR
jgi:hypothetical protein